MKKITAIIISALLIIAMLPMGAFAAQSKYEKVESQIDGARDYVFGSVTEFTYDKSADFYLFLNANGSYDKFEKAYNASVAEAYKAGKITDASAYACIILCTEKDPEKYPLGDGTTVNLVKEMEKCSPSISSPYYYRYIFEVANIYEVEQTFIDACLKQFLTLYTMGKGMDNYGYGCDNTANFITALLFAQTVSDIDTSAELADAKALLAGYKVDNGFFYNADYGKDPNADSTATALTAYSFADDEENANAVYDMLMKYAVSGKTGVFCASLSDTTENAYATKDALMSLISYYNILDIEEPVTKPESTTVSETTDATSTKPQTPSTGDNTQILVFCSVGVTAILGAVYCVAKKKVK